MPLRRELSTTIKFARMVLSAGAIPEVVAFIDDLTQRPAVIAPLIAALQSSAEGRAALRDRPRLGTIDLDALASLPEGTLGHVFAGHMRANGLDPAALPTRPSRTAEEWIAAHAYECHDVLHVVTGFGTERDGELGLNAFLLGQIPGRATMGVLAMGTLFTAAREFETYPARIGAVARGWLLGRRAKVIFGVDWKALWAVPLAEVRARYDLDVDGVARVMSTWDRGDALFA